MRLFTSRRLCALLLALVCISSAGSGIGAVAGADADGAVAVQDGEVAALEDGVAAQETATSTPTNNTTQQENPDEVGEDGDTEAVRSYLAQKLAERLGESSIQISQGEYEQGQSVLGDQYNDLLEKYVDVEGDTGDGTGSDSFEEAGENQREFANETQAYNETYQEYQEAKEAGNTTRARERARELDRLAEAVNSSGQNLTRSYAAVENTTGADLTNATQAVNETIERVSQQQAAVVSETFVETTLSVSVNRSTASFTQPTGVTGIITLENGSVLANETVRIRFGGREQIVTTDDEGKFTLSYRPVRAPTGAQEVVVAFLPADSSVYLGDRTSIQLDVTATTADLSVATDSETARFGEQVVVSGQAVVDGVAVEGATVRVMAGDRTLGTATTGADGSYQLATSLPATVAPGEANVTATIVPPDRAVRSDPARTTLEVDETQTQLQLNVTAESEQQVTVTGVLETVDGKAVDGRPVELLVNGTTVATIETGEDGHFDRTVSLPESIGNAAVVEAQYDEPSSNLESSSARERISLESDGAGENQGGPSLQETQLSSVPIELLLGGGGALVSLLGIAWLLRRSESEPVDEPSTPTATSTGSADSDERENALAAATSQFENGKPDAAVRALYGAMRQRLGSEADRTATHWEFYTTVSERVDDETAELVERLTQAYEREVYSPATVEVGTVEQLLRDAERLFGEQGSDDHE